MIAMLPGRGLAPGQQLAQQKRGRPTTAKKPVVTNQFFMTAG